MEPFLLDGEIMIFTKIEIDNLYCFHDFSLDLTFPRKKVKSTIPNEQIPGRPFFNYKKVCILSGANASGKTAFGKVMCGLQNFITRKVLSSNLTSGICNKKKPSKVVAEFVTISDHLFHKLEISFDKDDVNIENVKYASIHIGEKDSAASARRRLNNVFDKMVGKKTSKFISYNKSDKDKAEQINKFHALNLDAGWFYLLSDNIDAKLTFPESLQRDVLEAVLKTFDTSILSVEELKRSTKEGPDVEKIGFSILFKNGDQVITTKEGRIEQTDRLRLSRGTYEGMQVAIMLGEMKARPPHMTFFVDEQMAYSHTELEIAMLNTMIGLLEENAQLFFTTHNYDIMDMNLPVHSFIFFRKRGESAEAIHAEHYFKRSDRSLLNAIKNDVFKTMPKTSLIDALL